MSKKKILGVVLIVLMLLGSLSSCNRSQESSASTTSGSTDTSSSPRVVVAGHTGNARTTYQVGMEKFKEEVEKNTNGRFRVEIYPQTLGGDQELMQSLQIGTADFGEVNTSVLASIVPELGIFDLPFIFTSRDQAYAVFDGEIGDYFRQLVLDSGSGLVPVAYWENGFRNFTNNVRPIHNPDDMLALKMRSMQSNIHLEAFRLWGADPTPMSLSESITAMQQGVIDGQDNNIDTITANSMWEYQKYFSESWHFYGNKMLLFSNQFWSSLSDEDKEIFTNAAYAARDAEREECMNRYDQQLETLRSNGMEIVPHDEIDTEAFMVRVEPIYESYTAQYGDEYVNAIREIGKEV